jgi:stress response protein YsnF
MSSLERVLAAASTRGHAVYSARHETHMVEITEERSSWYKHKLITSGITIEQSVNSTKAVKNS